MDVVTDNRSPREVSGQIMHISRGVVANRKLLCKNTRGGGFCTKSRCRGASSCLSHAVIGVPGRVAEARRCDKDDPETTGGTVAQEIDQSFLALPRARLADAALTRARELGADHVDFRMER